MSASEGKPEMFCSIRALPGMPLSGHTSDRIRQRGNLLRHPDLLPFGAVARRVAGETLMLAVKRREFIALIGGAAAWPVVASAQQPTLPVVGFVSGSSHDAFTRYAATFLKGLGEAGYVEGQNVTIEYHWLNGQYDHLPSLMADLVRRRIAVIATPGSNAVALAAKTATATIPIVFGVGDDPVKLGLVTSLARPDGNMTGINFFTIEVTAKRLGLLHDLVPKAVRIAVLVNPLNASSTEATLRDVPEAARTAGLQIRVLEASTSRGIEAAFATLAREPAGALFVAADQFFASLHLQFATLAAHHGIPVSFADRGYPEVGGLMSYGPDFAEVYQNISFYIGRILNSAHPRELPVVQSTKFELVINMHTARTLGLDVSPGLLTAADEVIE
jgi:putative ABC transport system substrate-binding protein